MTIQAHLVPISTDIFKVSSWEVEGEENEEEEEEGDEDEDEDEE